MYCSRSGSEVEQLEACQAHVLKVGGSIPPLVMEGNSNVLIKKSGLINPFDQRINNLMTKKNTFFFVAGVLIGILTLALLFYFSFSVVDTKDFLLHLHKIVNVIQAFLNLVYLNAEIDSVFLKGLENDLIILQEYFPLLEELLFVFRR